MALLRSLIENTKRAYLGRRGVGAVLPVRVVSGGILRYYVRNGTSYIHFIVFAESIIVISKDYVGAFVVYGN